MIKKFFSSLCRWLYSEIAYEANYNQNCYYEECNNPYLVADYYNVSLIENLYISIACLIKPELKELYAQIEN